MVIRWFEGFKHMECELKDLNTAQGEANPQPPQRSEPTHDEGSAKDDRPLLKPEPAPVSHESLEELEKKFAAYVRHDVYGPMGRGELPLEEKVLLGIALVTLVPIRLVAAMIILLLYYAICRICTLFLAPNQEEGDQEDYAHMGGWRRAVIVQCGRALSRAMLFVFGFYWISQTYRTPTSHDKSSTVQVTIPILSLCDLWFYISMYKNGFLKATIKTVPCTTVPRSNFRGPNIFLPQKKKWNSISQSTGRKRLFIFYKPTLPIYSMNFF